MVSDCSFSDYDQNRNSPSVFSFMFCSFPWQHPYGKTFRRSPRKQGNFKADKCHKFFALSWPRVESLGKSPTVACARWHLPRFFMKRFSKAVMKFWQNFSCKSIRFFFFATLLHGGLTQTSSFPCRIRDFPIVSLQLPKAKFLTQQTWLKHANKGGSLLLRRFNPEYYFPELSATSLLKKSQVCLFVCFCCFFTKKRKITNGKDFCICFGKEVSQRILPSNPSHNISYRAMGSAGSCNQY